MAKVTNPIVKDHQRLLANIRLIQKHCTAPVLFEALGISRSTWFSKIKAPWAEFSYDDLCMIAKVARIQPQELIFGTLSLGGGAS